MSNSPKYTRPNLKAEQERRLREERERQKALERERRRQEEERRRRERLEQSRQAARRNVGAAATRASDLRGREFAHFVAADIQRLEAQVRQIEDEIDRAGDEAAIATQRRTLERLADEINRVVARGEAALLEARLMEQSRQSARREAGDAATRASDLHGREFAQFVAADIERLEAQARQIEAEIDRAGDQATIAAHRRTLERLKGEIKQVVARGEAALLAAKLTAKEAELAGVKHLAQALDERRSLRFDAAGLRAVRQTIAQAQAALDRKDLREAERSVEMARQQIDRHQAEVDGGSQRWSERRAAAIAALAQANDRLAGLGVDPVVARWKGRDLEGLRQRAQRAQSQIEGEQFEPAAAESAAIVAEASRLVDAAQETQLNEDRRAYVADGIMKVMREFGFVVESGETALEHPGYPESAYVIRAQRVGGGAIAVSVPQRPDEDIWYSIDGYRMREERGADGGSLRSCDEAEEQIHSMHRELAARFGIEMSELWWEGKDPTRIRKEAMRLPDYETRPSTSQQARTRST